MLNISKLNDALNWWGKGLGYLLPPSVRQIFHPVSELITIEFNNELILLKHFNGLSKKVADHRQFNETDKIEREIALNWLAERILMNSKVVLIVPDEIFLRKKIVLPKAANANLRQVLSFEMSRKTPFKAEQVYFDYLLNEKSLSEIHLELFLVPRDRIDSYLTTLKSWGVILDAIRPAKQFNNAHLNLISIEERPKNSIASDNSTLILTTINCLLLIAVLYAPTMKQKQTLSMLETEVAKYRKIAIQLNPLQEERKKLIEQSQFLQNKRKNGMSSIKLINEVTKIIPDDTWLTRFVMKSGELQLQGESSNASSLIQILASSAYFKSVQFRSPVIQSAITNKDKFYLSAEFMQE